MKKYKKKIKKTIFLSIIFFLALFFTFFRFGNNKAIAGEFEDWLKNRASGQGKTAIQVNGYWYAVPKGSAGTGSDVIPIPGTNYIKLKESDSDAIAPINLDDMKVKYTQETGKQPAAGSISNPNSANDTLSASTQGSPTTGGSQSSDIENPIAPKSIKEIFKSIMNYFENIAGTVAVIFIIVGGLMYMLSAGSKEMMERGKKTLIYALAGLAIVTAAPLFLSDIQMVLKGGGGSGNSKLMVVALNVLRLLLSIVGTLGIIGLMMGAVWMFTAAGDEDRLTLGKNAVKYSIIGILLAAGSVVLIKQVAALITG